MAIHGYDSNRRDHESERSYESFMSLETRNQMPLLTFQVRQVLAREAFELHAVLYQ